MKQVKTFYIRDYSFESQLYDDLQSYIAEHRDEWLNHRIEINYKSNDLRLVHLHMHLKVDENKLAEKWEKERKRAKELKLS